MAAVIAITVVETTQSHNIHFEGKLKNSTIYKLTITKKGLRPTQFKKIIDVLPVLCADKNFQDLNEFLLTGCDIVKTDFMLPYPNATQWSTTHHVQVSIVDPNDPEQPNGSRPICYEMIEQTHVFDANLQKKLLSEYKRNSKNKSENYAKFLAEKEGFNLNVIWEM